MSRYIDADSFFEEFEELDKEPYNNYPSADVVEVGKCKDCIHHGSFLPWCKIFDKRMNDDDYCSRFDERK